MFCAMFLAQRATAQVSFQELTTLPFLDNEAYLNGVSWVDVDNDNDLDVCVTGMKGSAFINQSAIFVQDANGNFSNTGLLTSAQKIPMRHGWADFNNDGALDLYIGATWNANGINELWQNNGGANLVLNTTTGSTPNTPLPFEGTVSWADYDNDGWVDLFLPVWNDQKNKLYHNTGTGNFTAVNTGAVVTGLGWTSGGYWGDFDNDNDQDLFVVNYQFGANTVGSNELFRNDGNGNFTLLANAGPLVTTQQNARSANWVDANNDGWLDVFVCAQFGQSVLHINEKDGTFSAQNVGPASSTSWSSNWGDFDNDGDQDLATIGFFGTDSQFWENDGQGNLTNITASYPAIFPTAISGSNSNGIIWVDYNLDGWLDLHVIQPDNVADRFYQNQGANCASWLEIKCVGQTSNVAAIGTTLRAKTTVNGNALWQMRQISAQTAATGTNPLWQHFGLGDATLLDSLVIQWPSGKVCVFTQVAANQVLEIKEDCTIDVIKAAPALEGSLQALSICQPATEPFVLETSAPAGGQWLSDCSGCVTDQGLFDPTGLSAGDYLVRYAQGGLCGGTVDSFLITIFPQPTLNITGKDTVEAGVKVALSASGAAQYVWSPVAGLSCSSCAATEFTADTTTLFTIIGTDANGCMDTVTHLVFVQKPLDITMPNAFSPNGDQNNDVFRPAYKGKTFLDYRLRIFSRWGERLYETITPGEGWDGRIGELPVESDVYIYIFEYTLSNGERDKLTGEVTLLR
jgi:enediyne biosynthesis protein E4